MNCADFERRLHEQIGSSRFDEAADLAEHAGRCAGCRTILDQFRLLADALPVWRDQIPDVDLTGSVMAAWQTQPDISATGRVGEIVRSQASSTVILDRSPAASMAGIVARPFLFRFHWLRSRRRQWLVAGSLVAIAVTALLLSPLVQERLRPGAAPDVAKQGSAAVVTAHDDQQEDDASGEVAPPIMAPDPAHAPYYDLAQKAAGALGEVTVFVTSGSAASNMPPAAARPEGATGWIDGLQHQLRPIGRSLDDAFDFLWQAGQSADSSKT